MAASPASRRWWEQVELKERWNGVFQGGGAKGIAYVGALRAVHCAGCWFRAVAGSSAGAITATLVAAGVHPDEMEQLSEEGLATVRKTRWWRHVAGFAGGEVPLYETEGLRAWLDGVLRRQVEALRGDREGEDDVTFAELHGASGIDLFVVTLDADGGAPVVLSRHNAGGAQVAWAAVASSAIPVAMRKQRLIMHDGLGGWRASRMFDGGGWANYPRFVFAEPSFRAHAGLPPDPEGTRTVGFALQLVGEEEQADLRLPSRFVDHPPVPQRRAPLRSARKRPGPSLWASALATGLALGAVWGVLLGGSWRLAASLALVAAVVALLFRRQLPQAFLAVLVTIAGVRVFRVAAIFVVGLLFVLALASVERIDALFETTPDTDETGGMLTTVGFVLSLVTPFAIFYTLAVIAGVMRFQAFLAQDALAVFGATLGAATRLPAWAGAGPGDHLVTVPVSPRIGTTDFVLPEGVRGEVIQNAQVAVAARVAQLLAIAPDKIAPRARAEQIGDGPAPGDEDLWPSEPPMGPAGWALLAGVLLLVVGGGTAYVALPYANTRAAGQIGLAIAAAGAIALGFGVWLSRRTGRQD